MLTIAGGLAFAGAKDAAAQGRHTGYSYTELRCQEYGQQPRYYQVRDPIPGSDWRNDGGWAIVLERGAIREISRELYYVRDGAIQSIPLANLAVNYNLPVAVGDGRTAYVRAVANPASALIDHDGDGDVDNADRPSSSHIRSVQISFPRYRITYGGGSYIRWANLQWCR